MMVLVLEQQLVKMKSLQVFMVDFWSLKRTVNAPPVHTVDGDLDNMQTTKPGKHSALVMNQHPGQMCKTVHGKREEPHNAVTPT